MNVELINAQQSEQHIMFNVCAGKSSAVFECVFFSNTKFNKSILYIHNLDKQWTSSR